MSDDKISGTYSTHLSGEAAAKIEETVEKRDITKSKAVREFIEAGIRHREGPGRASRTLSRIFEACLAATLILVVLSVIVVATAYPLIPAYLLGLLVLSAASSAVVVAGLQSAGVGDMIDRRLVESGVGV